MGNPWAFLFSTLTSYFSVLSSYVYCTLASCFMNFDSSAWYFAGATLDSLNEETMTFISYKAI